jgi:putative DNA primase/helicase
MVSEDDLAVRFVEQFGHDLRYVAKRGWLVWDGVRWKDDGKMRSYERARLVCRDAAQAVPPNLARIIASAKTRAAVVSLAQHDEQVAMEPDELDANLWLLNTPGGTVDLRSGALRRCDRNDHITRTTTVAPDFMMATPLWSAFLDLVTAGDRDLQGYLQRYAGYLLTGETVEHALFFLFGTGANGKTTFIRTVTGIMVTTTGRCR